MGVVEITMLEMEQLCQDPIMLDQMYITGKITYNKFKDTCDILSKYVAFKCLYIATYRMKI